MLTSLNLSSLFARSECYHVIKQFHTDADESCAKTGGHRAFVEQCDHVYGISNFGVLFSREENDIELDAIAEEQINRQVAQAKKRLKQDRELLNKSDVFSRPFIERVPHERINRNHFNPVDDNHFDPTEANHFQPTEANHSDPVAANHFNPVEVHHFNPVEAEQEPTAHSQSSLVDADFNFNYGLTLPGSDSIMVIADTNADFDLGSLSTANSDSIMVVTDLTLDSSRESTANSLVVDLSSSNNASGEFLSSSRESSDRITPNPEPDIEYEHDYGHLSELICID